MKLFVPTVKFNILFVLLTVFSHTLISQTYHLGRVNITGGVPHDISEPNDTLYLTTTNATQDQIPDSTYTVMLGHLGTGWVDVLVSPITYIDGIQPITTHTFTYGPNPFYDHINIKLHTPEKADIRLYDVLGKLVYHTSGTGNFTIQTPTQLSEGIYFLEISSSQKRATVKLLCVGFPLQPVGGHSGGGGLTKKNQQPKRN